MQKDVLKNIVKMVCDGYVETILTGIEEQNELFPYTIACANFISELKDKNILVNFNNIFTDKVSDKLFREASSYLVD